jgi:3-oxoacyl-[acyl-carrier-protein] synthase III
MEFEIQRLSKLNELLSAHHGTMKETDEEENEPKETALKSVANTADENIEETTARQPKVKRVTPRGASASIIAQLTEDLNKQEMAKVQTKLQEVI